MIYFALSGLAIHGNYSRGVAPGYLIKPRWGKKNVNPKDYKSARVNLHSDMWVKIFPEGELFLSVFCFKHRFCVTSVTQSDEITNITMEE